jgi:acylphosphatase
MVMFRDFVQRSAKKLGIFGTVHNTEDSAVSIKAEGEEAKLKELLVLVSKGPIFAKVDRVEETWSEPLGGYKSFDILY